jgi:hypothetical protein
MILPTRFIVLITLVIIAAGYGLPLHVEGHPLVGLIGLLAGTVGFIALNLVGYAIERRKPTRSSENRHEGHILISDCCLTSLKREREIETSKDHKDCEKPAESRRKC